MTDIAILGPTASGKTKIALNLAQKCGGVILSLDSLSVYKEINIASAKPNKNELKMIKHFGIDEIFCNEYFSVTIFFELYKKAKEYAMQRDKQLFIVGGTSFYLKALLSGISSYPSLDLSQKQSLKNLLQDRVRAYEILKQKDEKYAQKISINDSYRLEKALGITLFTDLSVTEWFLQNPPVKIIEDIKIFSIKIKKEKLLLNIKKRTEQMFANGLINEAATLEQKYPLSLSPLRSIGLKEVYLYLNAKISLAECKAQICTHTAQLAKRQETFNKGQFEGVCYVDENQLKDYKC